MQMGSARATTEREATPELLALARAAKRGEDIVVEDGGERLAVLVRVEEYDAIAAARRGLFDLIRSIQDRHKDEDPDEVDRFVLEQIREMRAERRQAA
jgi:hypothetical protein